MTTTTQALRAITKNKAILQKLQEEVGCIGLNPEPGIENTRTMDFLCAVVNESLRLFNPFPLGSQATTPPSGVDVNGTYIPGNVDVWVPHKLLMTDPRYFPQGGEFIPERWLVGNEELLRDRKAFIPWSYGAHSCVGKHFGGLFTPPPLILSSLVLEARFSQASFQSNMSMLTPRFIRSAERDEGCYWEDCLDV